ncbi:MAG: RtcB family protein [Bacteroidia bacterium]|nr:RtcB family protein [Bacteroidia bacterium]
MKNLKVFGAEIIDEKCISQIKNCISENDLAVLTADAHYGYGHPIGGAIAYKDKVSLSGVGFDIACGNKAVRTNIKADEIDVPKIMDELFKRISFGVGRHNNEPVDHEVFDKIANAEFEPQRQLLGLAKAQLGTVGSGNHYVDLFKDAEGFLWIGNHFGSRGFGHKTAMGFIAMFQGLRFEDKAKEGSMDAPPILFDTNTFTGQAYINAMHLAGEYAYAGRDMVINKVLEILDNPLVTFEVHNHHNFAWKENHFGSDYWVVRKGCTPAFPNQLGFIGANMLDNSVIIEGVENEQSKDTLYSTVHGAGRVMSRTEAAGKKKWIKDENGRKKPTVIAKGKVDFDEVKAKMKERKIELRGAGADEAPQCYKKLNEVLGYMGDTIRILHELEPIGVAMAGNETYDPYKD